MINSQKQLRTHHRAFSVWLVCFERTVSSRVAIAQYNEHRVSRNNGSILIYDQQVFLYKALATSDNFEIFTNTQQTWLKKPPSLLAYWWHLHDSTLPHHIYTASIFENFSSVTPWSTESVFQFRSYAWVRKLSWNLKQQHLQTRSMLLRTKECL